MSSMRLSKRAGSTGCIFKVSARGGPRGAEGHKRCSSMPLNLLSSLPCAEVYGFKPVKSVEQEEKELEELEEKERLQEEQQQQLLSSGEAAGNSTITALSSNKQEVQQPEAAKARTPQQQQQKEKQQEEAVPGLTLEEVAEAIKLFGECQLTAVAERE